MDQLKGIISRDLALVGKTNQLITEFSRAKPNSI